MKKFFLLFFLILFFLPFFSAVEFSMKGNFSQGETMIAKVSGNFLTSITKTDIVFYEGHVRIPVEYDVAKVNEDYYIYASLLEKTQGNYSIYINDVKYMSGNQIITGSLARNFTITNETADFSLKPGFVVSSSGFSLELQNLEDNPITIDVKTQATNGSERDISISQPIGTVKEISFSLKSGEIEKIDFSLGNGLPTFQTVELSSSNLTYEVPIYIFSSSQQTQTPQSSFMIQPSEMIVSIPTNSVTKKTVYIYNTGDADITNISLSLSDEINPFVNLSQYKIDNLAAKSNVPIELSFFSPGETEADGTLKASEAGILSYSSISINFLNNYTPPNETAQSYTTKLCADIPGVICSSGQQCTQETVYAKDNVCCLGECSTTQNGSPWTGRIIAIVIIVLILGAALWFYFKKFKKAKKPVNLLDIAKGKKD